MYAYMLKKSSTFFVAIWLGYIFPSASLCSSFLYFSCPLAHFPSFPQIRTCVAGPCLSATNLLVARRKEIQGFVCVKDFLFSLENWKLMLIRLKQTTMCSYTPPLRRPEKWKRLLVWSCSNHSLVWWSTLQAEEIDPQLALCFIGLILWSSVDLPQQKKLFVDVC